MQKKSLRGCLYSVVERIQAEMIMHEMCVFLVFYAKLYVWRVRQLLSHAKVYLLFNHRQDGVDFRFYKMAFFFYLSYITVNMHRYIIIKTKQKIIIIIIIYLGIRLGTMTQSPAFCEYPCAVRRLQARMKMIKVSCIYIWYISSFHSFILNLTKIIISTFYFQPQ